MSDGAHWDAAEMSAEEYRKRSPRSKYGNVKTVVDGITFDSKAEAARYRELRLMHDAGEIEHIQVQPRYPLEVMGVKVCTYVADFAFLDYREGAGGALVVEDVKGVKTDVYRIKKKLMKAIHGIDVREITR